MPLKDPNGIMKLEDLIKNLTDGAYNAVKNNNAVNVSTLSSYLSSHWSKTLKEIIKNMEVEMFLINPLLDEWRLTNIPRETLRKTAELWISNDLGLSLKDYCIKVLC